jgi:hypothetical protein
MCNWSCTRVHDIWRWRTLGRRRTSHWHQRPTNKGRHLSITVLSWQVGNMHGPDRLPQKKNAQLRVLWSVRSYAYVLCLSLLQLYLLAYYTISLGDCQWLRVVRTNKLQMIASSSTCPRALLLVSPIGRVHASFQLVENILGINKKRRPKYDS